MVSEVVNPDRSTGLDNRIRQRHAVVGPGLGGLAACRPPSPDYYDGQEEQGYEDYGYYDAQDDGCVVLI